jgi:N-methylhydantoinase A
MPLGADYALIEVPIYRRGGLLAGNLVDGPAVVEDEATTIFVPERSRAEVDDYGNIRIELEEDDR